jgi:hypothetical protein
MKQISDFCYTRATKTCFSKGEAGYGFSYIGNEGFIDKITAEQILAPVCSCINISENNERLFAVLPEKNNRYLSVISAVASSDGNRRTPFIYGYLLNGEAKSAVLSNRRGKSNENAPNVPYLTDIFDKKCPGSIYYGTPEAAADIKAERGFCDISGDIAGDLGICGFLGLPKPAAAKEIGLDEFTFKELAVIIRACIKGACSQVFYIVRDKEKLFDVGRGLISLLYAYLPPAEVSKLGVVISDTADWVDSQVVKGGELVYNIPQGDRALMPGAVLYILSEKPSGLSAKSVWFDGLNNNMPDGGAGVDNFSFLVDRIIPAVMNGGEPANKLFDFYKIFDNNEEALIKYGITDLDLKECGFIGSLVPGTEKAIVSSLNSSSLPKFIRYAAFFINNDINIGYDFKTAFRNFLKVHYAMPKKNFENPAKLTDNDIVTLFELSKKCGYGDLNLDYWKSKDDENLETPLFNAIIKRANPASKDYPKIIKAIKDLGGFDDFIKNITAYYDKKKETDIELAKNAVRILIEYGESCETFDKKAFLAAEADFLADSCPDLSYKAFCEYLTLVAGDDKESVLSFFEKILTKGNTAALGEILSELKKNNLFGELIENVSPSAAERIGSTVLSEISTKNYISLNQLAEDIKTYAVICEKFGKSENETLSYNSYSAYVVTELFRLLPGSVYFAEILRDLDDYFEREEIYNTISRAVSAFLNHPKMITENRLPDVLFDDVLGFCTDTFTARNDGNIPSVLFDNEGYKAAGLMTDYVIYTAYNVFRYTKFFSSMERRPYGDKIRELLCDDVLTADDIAAIKGYLEASEYVKYNELLRIFDDAVNLKTVSHQANIAPTPVCNNEPRQGSVVTIPLAVPVPAPAPAPAVSDNNLFDYDKNGGVIYKGYKDLYYCTLRFQTFKKKDADKCPRCKTENYKCALLDEPHMLSPLMVYFIGSNVYSSQFAKLLLSLPDIKQLKNYDAAGVFSRQDKQKKTLVNIVNLNGFDKNAVNLVKSKFEYEDREIFGIVFSENGHFDNGFFSKFLPENTMNVNVIRDNPNAPLVKMPFEKGCINQDLPIASLKGNEEAILENFLDYAVRRIMKKQI